MDARTINAEVLAGSPSFGPGARRLRLGEDRLRLEGLDEDLTRILERRYGAFVEAGATGRASSGDYRLEVVRSERNHWLQQLEPAEVYRLEAFGPPASRVVLSYHFALCEVPAGPGRQWRVAIADDPNEPLGRILDNVARFLTARWAIDRGGFAMHGAGVLRSGRAHVFAGPSRSGKSTAVRLSGALSLGDDFAVVVPSRGRWRVPALPFDNAESIAGDPPSELSPLATVWRLFQAERHTVERPRGLMAITSLMSCVAFPWALPESADVLLSRATQLVNEGHFGHLHFRLDPGFSRLLT